VLLVRFVLCRRFDILWIIYPFKFSAHVNWRAVYVLSKCGREASPSGVRSQFLGETAASKLKGNAGTIIKRCSDKIVSSAGHSELAVIVELM
jgi:hypothetical protein